MPVRNYRERAGLSQGLQFSGANAPEMIEFAPDFLYMDDQTLMVKGHPHPVLATQWVIKTERGVYRRLDDTDFNILWEPGQ